MMSYFPTTIFVGGVGGGDMYSYQRSELTKVKKIIVDTAGIRFFK